LRYLFFFFLVTLQEGPRLYVSWNLSFFVARSIPSFPRWHLSRSLTALIPIPAIQSTTATPLAPNTRLTLVLPSLLRLTPSRSFSARRPVSKHRPFPSVSPLQHLNPARPTSYHTPPPQRHVQTNLSATAPNAPRWNANQSRNIPQPAPAPTGRPAAHKPARQCLTCMNIPSQLAGSTQMRGGRKHTCVREAH
jgi:hypothetical protein